MRAICYSECVQVLTFMIRVSSCKTIGFFRLLLLPPPPIPPPPPPRPHVGILWHLETLMGSCLVDFDIPETLPRCPSILKDPPTGQDLERIPESLPRQRFFGRLFWQEQIADTWRHRVGTITSFRSPPPPPPSPPSVPPPGVCLREQEEKKLWRKRASCCDWRDAAEAAAAAAKWHHPAISSYLSSISSFFSHSFLSFSLSLTGYSSVSSPPPFLRPSLFLPFSSFRLFRKFLPAFSFGFSFYSPRLCHSIRKYRDSSGFFKILQDSSRFFRILQDSSGFFRILQDSSGFFRILQNSSGLCLGRRCGGANEYCFYLMNFRHTIVCVVFWSCSRNEIITRINIILYIKTISEKTKSIRRVFCICQSMQAQKVTHTLISLLKER